MCNHLSNEETVLYMYLRKLATYGRIFYYTKKNVFFIRYIFFQAVYEVRLKLYISLKCKVPTFIIDKPHIRLIQFDIRWFHFRFETMTI